MLQKTFALLSKQNKATTKSLKPHGIQIIYWNDSKDTDENKWNTAILWLSVNIFFFSWAVVKSLIGCMWAQGHSSPGPTPWVDFSFFLLVCSAWSSYIVLQEMRKNVPVNVKKCKSVELVYNDIIEEVKCVKIRWLSFDYFDKLLRSTLTQSFSDCFLKVSPTFSCPAALQLIQQQSVL